MCRPRCHWRKRPPGWPPDSSSGKPTWSAGDSVPPVIAWAYHGDVSPADANRILRSTWTDEMFLGEPHERRALVAAGAVGFLRTALVIELAGGRFRRRLLVVAGWPTRTVGAEVPDV